MIVGMEAEYISMIRQGLAFANSHKQGLKVEGVFIIGWKTERPYLTYEIPNRFIRSSLRSLETGITFPFIFTSDMSNVST